MSEFERTEHQNQASLLSVVDELEQGLDALTASLDSLRATIRVVAQQVRSIEQAPASAAPLLTVAEHTPADIAEPEPAPPDVTEGVFSWAPRPVETPVQPFTPASQPEPVAELEEPAAALPVVGPSDAERDEVRRAVEAARAELDAPEPTEAVRDEVRRAVEASRAELSWSNLRVDSGFSFAPTEPLDAPAAPEVPAEPVALDDEAARREEVRLAVERARADMMAANEEAPAVDPEEARREEVRLAVERARAEMMGQTEAPVVNDDEARREEVRRMVESTRGALSWNTMKADTGSWGQFKPEPGGFSIGPDQAPPRPLERSEEPLPKDPEEARREEVRRAVESARSEMAPPDDGPKIVPLAPRPGAPLPKGADFNGPPVIVVEDPLGRVELSQVFATLSRVDRSAQAALLNYSPHSVTIGLGMTTPVPDPNQLVLAAQAVFGRSCTVKAEGNRTAIEVGTHPVG